MSAAEACAEVVAPGAREEFRRENWRVAALRCNYSAFNGYAYTPSDYSEVRCLSCGARWRTKAAYVDRLDLLS